MSLTKGSAAPWARRWAPVLAWGGVILVMTSWPNATLPIDLDWSDEFAHLCVYTVLGWLSGRAMLRPRPIGRVFMVLIALAAFGAVDEVHQFLVPNRVSTVADWIADVLGASLGLFTYHFIRARLTPGTTTSA